MIEQYAKQEGLDVSEAERRLALQRRAGDLVTAVEQAAGSMSGGVWFDNAVGEYVVGISSPAARDAVDNVIAERDLIDQTRVEDVRVPFAALQRAVSDMSERSLADEIEAGLVSPLIYTPENRVKILLSDAASEYEVSRVRAVAEESDVAVEVVSIPASDMSYTTKACAWRFCSRPLRGGVAIIKGANPDYDCTAGYAGFRPSTGERVLLTAGHCPYGSTATWYSRPAPGSSKEVIGTSFFSVYGSGYGDAAAIANLGYWNTTLSPIIVTWDSNKTVYNEAYPLYDRARSAVGEFGCRYGATSPIACGYVNGVEQTIPISGGPTLQHMTMTNSCANFGDSGGPWIKANTALGIVSGGTLADCSDPPPFAMFYTEVLDAEYWLGVRAVTYATGAY